LKEAEEAKAKV